MEHVWRIEREREKERQKKKNPNNAPFLNGPFVG